MTLVVDDLTMCFSQTVALDHVSFRAEAGNVTAIVGANGAGKTTLFSILAGVTDPDSGTCTLDSIALRDWDRRNVGYLASEPFFYNKLNAHQMLSLERTLRAIECDDDALGATLEQWEVTSFADKPLGTLSQGMRKRALMACAFLGDPSLVILDEPLNGLDVQGVFLLEEAVERAQVAGAHVLMCSHVLDFIQRRTDKVFFLRNGRITDECDPRRTSLEEVYRRGSHSRPDQAVND
jgi:ABC-type multidrug transport system ATPase subunit